MHHRKVSLSLIILGVLLVIATGVFFMLPTQSVSAQCGSQASSCKNCHETQGQGPVNDDLTTWHGQHAFGDFCYLCHGGNNQATDKAAAHVGLVYPLEDVVISCKSCHPIDYEARAQLYADTLGIKAGSMKATLAATPDQPSSAAPTSAVVSQPAVAAAVPAAVVPVADMVDYSQRYAEVVLGKKPLNVGNAILTVFIAAMLLGGGYFIARREGLFKLSFQESKQIQGSYPVDVVDMVPALARLKPAARRDLNKLLAKPATAAELFALASKIAGTAVEPPAPADEKVEE